MFARKTVDGVLAVFHKTIADLGLVAEEQNARAEAKRIEAQQAQAEAEACALEAQRARNVASKLEAVICDDSDGAAVPVQSLRAVG